MAAQPLPLCLWLLLLVVPLVVQLLPAAALLLAVLPQLPAAQTGRGDEARSVRCGSRERTAACVAHLLGFQSFQLLLGLHRLQTGVRDSHRAAFMCCCCLVLLLLAHRLGCEASLRLGCPKGCLEVFRHYGAKYAVFAERR